MNLERIYPLLNNNAIFKMYTDEEGLLLAVAAASA